MSLLRKLRASGYPRQFWVLFFGQLISAAGGSMAWPFFSIYMHNRLGISLTLIGTILGVSAALGLPVQTLAGTWTDRWGRKNVILIGLLGQSISIGLLGLTTSVPLVITIILVGSTISAMMGPAMNAMIADLVVSERRSEAYGLIRITANLGVTIGPSIGGFLATRSYSLLFLTAAGVTFLFVPLVLFLTHETKPDNIEVKSSALGNEEGYRALLLNQPFVITCIALILSMLAYSQMVSILPVYMTEYARLSEASFGWVMSTNAALIVLFQFSITRGTARYGHLPVMAAGALFTAIGVGAVAISNHLWAFFACVIILTIGEMLIMPTSTAYVASLAPEHLRGRYMGVLNIAWSLGQGVGPMLGGMINDHLTPRAVWPSMGALGLLSAAILWSMKRAVRVKDRVPGDGSSQ